MKCIEKQIKKGEFDSRAYGVRRCILITMRVYENATLEELIKFVHGKGVKKRFNQPTIVNKVLLFLFGNSTVEWIIIVLLIIKHQVLIPNSLYC